MLKSLFRSTIIKIKAGAFLYGFSRTVVVTLVLFEFLFIIDFFVELPAFLRLFLFCSIVSFSLVALYKYVITSIFFNPQYSDVALLVEKYTPQLNELLTTAVDIEEKKIKTNAYFLSKITESIKQQLVSLKLPILVNVKRVALWSFIFLIFASGCFGLITQYPDYADVFASRLLGNNIKWPGALEFFIAGANENVFYVTKGDDLDVTVNVLNKVVPRVKIYYWTSKDSVTKDMKKLQSDLFTYRISTVLEDLKFYVYSSGSYSETYKVAVRSPPSITQITFNVQYPKYLRSALGESATFVNTPNIEVPQLSQVDIAVSTSRKISSATLQLVADKKDSSILMKNTVEFVHTSSITCDFYESFISFKILDMDGIANPDSTIYRIVTLKDNKPVVQFESPSTDEDISAICGLPIQVKLLDDFGLKNFSLNVNLNGKDWHKEDHAVENKKNEAFEYVLDGQKHNFKEGDILKVTAVAQDIKDVEPLNISTSRPLTLRVVPADSLESLYQDKILSMKQRIENVYYREKDLAVRFNKLNEWITADSIDWSQTAKKIAYDQDSLTKTLNNIHKDFINIETKVSYNRLFNDKARQKIRDAIAILEQILYIDGEPGKEKIARLDSLTTAIFSLIKESKKEMRQSLYGEINNYYKDVPKLLHQVLLKLDDWLTYESMLSAMKKIKGNAELLKDKVKDQAKCEDCRLGKRCSKHTVE